MVSKPNFVLGIKQKSLASKKDSHVHITVRNHTCLFAGFRLHNISQSPWLTAVSSSSSPSIHVSPYKICAHQAFACQNRHHRYAPRPPARKTQKYGQPKASHAPQLASENYHAPPQIPDFQIVFVHMRRHDGLLVHRSTWPENLVVNRFCMRHLGF